MKILGKKLAVILKTKFTQYNKCVLRNDNGRDETTLTINRELYVMLNSNHCRTEQDENMTISVEQKFKLKKK